MINAWALLYDELYDEEGKMITPDDERDYLKWVKEMEVLNILLNLLLVM